MVILIARGDSIMFTVIHFRDFTIKHIVNGVTL